MIPKGKLCQRVVIPNRVDIESHPEIADTKQCFGDWEVDTVADDEISNGQRSLNLRPRKCLGYRQIAVVFDELRSAA